MKQIEINDDEIKLLSATFRAEYDLYCEAVEMAEECEDDTEHIKELIRDRDLSYNLLVKIGADMTGIQKQADRWVRKIEFSESAGKDCVNHYCPVCGWQNNDHPEMCDNCGASLIDPE